MNDYQLHSNFGAPYYDSDISMWLSVYTERELANSELAYRSVDPLADARSWVSPYSYVQNSPVMRVDPSGALDDWYETPEGEKKYDENIHSAKDMKDMGIDGEYLGKTYKEGNNYYSLFGEIKDLSTKEGKLYEKMDETFINYAEYLKEYDKWAWEEPTEGKTDFNIGIPYKENFLGAGDYNFYQFEYEGATGYYQVYGDPSAMKGRLDWGEKQYMPNKNYGFKGMKPGYNVHFYVVQEPKLDIVTLVFPTLNSRNSLKSKWKNEFFPK